MHIYVYIHIYIYIFVCFYEYIEKKKHQCSGIDLCCLPLPPVASRCLPLPPVASRCLPLPPVASRCLPVPPVVSRDPLGYLVVSRRLQLSFSTIFPLIDYLLLASRVSFWPLHHCHPPTLLGVARHYLILSYIYIYIIIYT